jgi:hypothetical protein
MYMARKSFFSEIDTSFRVMGPSSPSFMDHTGGNRIGWSL